MAISKSLTLQSQSIGVCLMTQSLFRRTKAKLHTAGEDKPTEKAIKHRITKIKTDTETKAESANDEEAKTAGTTKRKRKE